MIHLFFSKHAKTLPGGMEAFSENFMNLVATMLLPKTATRLALAEIKKHPWMKEEVATEEEVVEEMQARIKLMNDAVSQSSKETIPTSQAATDIITEYEHRGDGDSEVVKDALREARVFDTESNNLNSFFSTSPAPDLFDALASFAAAMTKDLKFSPKSYKVDLKLLRKNKQGMEFPVSLSIEILKVEDEDKYCVEFWKKKGDYLEFARLVNDARSYFAGHVNATLDRINPTRANSR